MIAEQIRAEKAGRESSRLYVLDPSKDTCSIYDRTVGNGAEFIDDCDGAQTVVDLGLTPCAKRHDKNSRRL
jgi:hypothetical protein